MNVEFGHGRMKEMHRKTILKHLKADLYSYSYSCIKKAESKSDKTEEHNYQRKKKFSMKKTQKFYIKFAAKTDSEAGKIKRFC